MRTRTTGILGFLALACSGACATIQHGTEQTVLVTSDPSGAAVTVLSHGEVTSTPGFTPIRLELARGDPRLSIRLEKQGCASAEVRLKRTASGWLFANLAVGPTVETAERYGPRVAGQHPADGGSLAGAMFLSDLIGGGAFNLPKVVDVPLCRDAARPPRQGPHLAEPDRKR